MCLCLIVFAFVGESESGALFVVGEDQSKPGTGICWVNTHHSRYCCLTRGMGQEGGCTPM